MSKLSLTAKLTASTSTFTLIQLVLTGGLSWFLYGLTLQSFSKVLPNVSFGAIGLGLLFAFDYGTSSSRIGDPVSGSKLASTKLWSNLVGKSDNDFGLQLFGRTVIVSSLIALAIYQFVIPLLSS